VTDEYQGGIEVLVVLLDVVGIVLGGLPLVHRVEVDAGIIGLDGLKEGPESILKTTFSQWSAARTMEGVRRTTWDRFAVAGIPFRPFHSFQHHP
jgi:hypothetical protein